MPGCIAVVKYILEIRFLLRLSVILSVLLPVGIGNAAERFTLSGETLLQAEKKYGVEARQRLLDWQALINSDQGAADSEKLKVVNRFFNRMEFVSDAEHWGREDYWATPVEMLISQGGDCEDFSIAKYFTLKAMGIPESKLNLTYVKALRLNQHHMVMTYYSKPTAEPLVLDNLTAAILPASKRTDLLPIYSFNGSALWLAKQRGRGKLVGSSSRLKRWQELLQRMPVGIR